MADPQGVKVIEVCRVSPDLAVVPMTLPLTFFDILWLRFPPVERLFFYQFSSSSSDTDFFENIIPKLRNSLSLILSDYLPLAGNLIWPENSPKPIVEFRENDAVSLTVAESTADFHHLSGDGLRKATEFHPLIPKLPASYERVPVISLQITLFQNTGFSIGITTHHAILDGKSSTSFIKSWARLCNFGSNSPAIEHRPSYDRTVLNDPLDLAGIYSKELQSIEGPNNRSLKYLQLKTPSDSMRGTFKLSRHSLEKLKQWVVNQQNHKAEAVHLSSFTVATAFIWVCLAKSNGSKDKVVVGIPADARARLVPPLPANYFGNCVVGVMAGAERSELLGENGVVLAVERISKGIKEMESGVLKDAETWISLMDSLRNEDNLAIGIAGSARFEVYGTNFGWGKAKKVEMISIDKTGAVCMSDSRDGDGLEIGWVAPTNIIQSFAAAFDQSLEAL